MIEDDEDSLEELINGRNNPSRDQESTSSEINSKKIQLKNTVGKSNAKKFSNKPRVIEDEDEDDDFSNLDESQFKC